MLLFHLDDLTILREIRSNLDNYGFHIRMKWDVVNLVPFTNSEDSSLKVPSRSHMLSLDLFFLKLNFCLQTLQTLLSHVIFSSQSLMGALL